MKVLDLFSGSGSSTQAFEDAGHSVFKVEMSHDFQADHYADILHTYPYDIDYYGPYDFVWASPPCTTFSSAARGMNHFKDNEPQTQAASDAVSLVAHTIRLIASLTPKYWVMENPRATLRKLEVVRGIPITEISYCQYGAKYQKLTDLFGVLPDKFQAKVCGPNDPCHLPAPRSDKYSGLLSIPKADRSLVPYGLSQALLNSFA